MKTFKNPRDIKVGVIGYGGAFNMGKAHLNQMKKAGMTPYAVCEVDPERLKVAETDWPGIETYGKVEDMLKKSDVDLVVHITPHNLHYPLAAKCVKAGKHVVTEKPFVVTTNEADKLIALAEKHDVMVSTYHNRHWDGWILRARKEVEKGSIGDVHRVELRFGKYGPPQDWWRTSKSISGGVMYDWGVHLLEYALQVTPGNIVEVAGFAKTGHWEKEIGKKSRFAGDFNEDEAAAIVRFDTGAVIDMRISQLDPIPRPPMSIFGNKGSYVIESFHSEERGWVMNKADAKYKLKETMGKHSPGKQHLFYKNIADFLTGKDELIITPQWARRPIHILDLADRSAKQNKTLKAKHG
ncbi:MAG: Gfo/Idh/MocA family protein [Phycisphaeraceae bacterium]